MAIQPQTAFHATFHCILSYFVQIEVHMLVEVWELYGMLWSKVAGRSEFQTPCFKSPSQFNGLCPAGLPGDSDSFISLVEPGSTNDLQSSPGQ
jgi:hypothetical protein